MIRRPPPNLDSTAAATYSPPEFELATAVDAPPPEEFGFGGAAVIVVSPDDVDVEPLDAAAAVPFLATHCPLDEPEAEVDPPPEGYGLGRHGARAGGKRGR
jgi:hypothetical protein